MGARLDAVLARINCRTLADIGCDHGKVAVGALLEGRAERCIATDISEKCLQKARELARTKGVDKIEFRVGDGLSVLAPFEADCVVIAGMGGREIASVLQKAPPLKAKFILVPHDDAPLLRRFLAENGYGVESDRIVGEGRRFYPVIVCEKTGVKRSLSLLESLYGTHLSDADCAAYMRLKESSLARICAGIKQGDERGEKLKEELRVTSEALKERK